MAVLDLLECVGVVVAGWKGLCEFWLRLYWRKGGGNYSRGDWNVAAIDYFAPEVEWIGILWPDMCMYKSYVFILTCGWCCTHTL